MRPRLRLAVLLSNSSEAAYQPEFVFMCLQATCSQQHSCGKPGHGCTLPRFFLGSQRLLSVAFHLALQPALQTPCELRLVHLAQLSPVQRAGTPQPAPNSTEASCLAVARDLQREARQWRDTQFSDWSARTMDSLGSIKVDQSGKLMDMDSRDGRIRLHYNENLVTLLRQVGIEVLTGHLGSLRFDQIGSLSSSGWTRVGHR